jgi:ethanolamine permease
MSEPQRGQVELRKALGPVMLWGLGVGYVISGEYFGWNLGLPQGGTYGMLAATLLVTLMYVAFVLSYAELACAIPTAGGAFDYALRALGPVPGFLAGALQFIEFVFAPPAIALAIGAYLHIYLPIDPLWIAVACYLLPTWGGIAALLTGKTGDIIVLSCFGAVGLYIVSMISLFALRRREPDLLRPFRAVLYPVFPAVALVLAATCLAALVAYYPAVAAVFAAIMAGGLAFAFWHRRGPAGQLG